MAKPTPTTTLPVPAKSGTKPKAKLPDNAKPVTVEPNIRRLRQAGRTSFQVRYKPRGKPPLNPVFDTLDEARETLRNAKVTGKRPVPKKITLSTAIEDYRSHLKDLKQYSDYENTYCNLLQRFFEATGDRALDSIERGTVEALVTNMLDTIKIGADEETGATYAASTVRKVYFQLKKVLVWHSGKFKWRLEADLFPSRDKLVPSAHDEDDMRERRLHEGEEFAIYLKARRSINGKTWIRLIALTLETALRAQEILFARWKEVSFDSRIWRIPKKNSKTGKARQVPLTERAIRLLLEQKPKDAKPEDRVFDTWKDTRTMGLTFQRICVRAGVLDFRFHDLRHTAITRLVAEGHPPALLMKITGHSKYITFERYVNLSDNELVGIVAKSRDAKRSKLRKKDNEAQAPAAQS